MGKNRNKTWREGCEERIILNMHQLGKSAEEISVLTGCSEEIVLEVLNHGKIIRKKRIKIYKGRVQYNVSAFKNNELLNKLIGITINNSSNI